MLLLSLALLSAWWVAKRITKESTPSTLVPTNALELLVTVERQAAAEFWKPELDAQERGKIVEALWDSINQSTNRLATFLKNFSPVELKVPVFAQATPLPHGIRVFKNSPGASGNAPASLLLKWQQDGWELAACEARFIRISPDTFYVSAHLVNERTAARAIVEGNVVVEFGDVRQPFRIVDASALELRVRQGAPPFKEMFYAQVPPHEGSFFIDPLIVWDLDGDGQLEVILAAANVVLRREAARWRPDTFIEPDPGLIFGGILGDFNGDGEIDYLVVRFEGAALYEGSGGGHFSQTPRPVWTAQPRLKYAQCFTAGDIDADGDLDLFVGQYKLPYSQGQMPFPYFDANDGFPSFLLANDGKGNFTDITQTAGLAAKRGRRVYSSSLVDLDLDRDLDLVLVSDFAGLDVFANDGAGRFTDVTSKWFDERYAFGMAHSFADFNADGRLDLLMIGMNSPTADRLGSRNLNRDYDLPDAGMRKAVTFGNRLFYGSSSGKWTQNDLGAQVARTGWSWGAAAGDFDNDGFSDLYIANGHATGALVHDYEPEFWMHDIYIGKSQENWLADDYFRQKFTRRGSNGHSYGGHERNRLFINQNGTNFTEVAHLFGVAMTQDSRNAAWQDLDGDGRVDLIVTTFEAYPEVRQTIRFFRNELPTTNHVDTVRLTKLNRTGASGKLAAGRTNAFAIVSGESYRTQLPPEFRIGSSRAASPEVPGETNLFQLGETRKR